jgi:predicted DNA-binding transcriptional regulator AlpA
MSDTPNQKATLLSTADVLARLGIGRTTLWEMEKRGIIPKAIQLNRRCKRWRAADIDQFIAQRWS